MLNKARHTGAVLASVFTLMLLLSACSRTPDPKGFGTAKSLGPILGVRVPSLVCPTLESPPSTIPRRADGMGALKGKVTEFVICEFLLNSHVARPLPMTATSGSDFLTLESALRASDQLRIKGRTCDLYLDSDPAILARTSEGSWLVHLPVDGCDHYQVAVSNAVIAAIKQAAGK